MSCSLSHSVTVFITARNSALSEMNEENLLYPPGQRLVQKSGSQLNPPPASCQRRPAPSHSAQGLVEIRGRLFPCACCQKSAWREKDDLKNKPTTANMSFCPVWANQQEICHLIFSRKCTSLSNRAASIWMAERSTEKHHLMKFCQKGISGIRVGVCDSWRGEYMKRGNELFSQFDTSYWYVCLYTRESAQHMFGTFKCFHTL